jgi:hypothetical protein
MAAIRTYGRWTASAVATSGWTATEPILLARNAKVWRVLDASCPGLQQVWKRCENQPYEANTADKSENELHVHGILSIIFQE